MGEREYRVWEETGDLIAVYDNPGEAWKKATVACNTCPCGTDGRGGECGVLDPHGISVRVIEDGQDITEQINRLVGH